MQKKRGIHIRKFIQIADELLNLRNFQSLCAFYGALNSTAIIRLDNAWDHVGNKYINRFEEMKLLFKTDNNMSNLRKFQRESKPPMIPYTGVLLKDLIALEEGSRKRNKIDGKVNFSRLMRLSDRIKNALIYQNTVYVVKSSNDSKFQTRFRAMLFNEFRLNKNVSTDDILDISNKIRRQDNGGKKPIPKKNKKNKSRPGSRRTSRKNTHGNSIGWGLIKKVATPRKHNNKNKSDATPKMFHV